MAANCNALRSIPLTPPHAALSLASSPIAGREPQRLYLQEARGRREGASLVGRAGLRRGACFGLSKTKPVRHMPDARQWPPNSSQGSACFVPR